FNGRLYAGDNNGRVYQISPVTATVSGVDGAITGQTLSGFGLNLVTSTTAFTCSGVWPCIATNQAIFTISDRAGNVTRFGPYAILVDTLTPSALAVSTPSLPANGA